MKRPTPAMLAAGFGALALLTVIGGSWLLERDKLYGELLRLAPTVSVAAKPGLDRAMYDRKLRELAHVPDSAAMNDGLRWPVRAAYPDAGAILPFKRIVAYYGNFLSRGMGVLGEYPEDVMIGMFKKEIAAWEAADPATPVMPAVDYIAITAQASAGDDGMYRARMRHTEIEKALAIAEKLHGIVILEVQAGKADLMGEIKTLEPYLAMPQVHLAIDPEFRMKYGQPPGQVVGTVDAADVNEAVAYLSGLVWARRLPPKVLIIHRYTGAMVTHADKIVPRSEVQIVMDMDGWGPPDRKYSTYNSWIGPEPVQFTGFKLFYKNDIKTGVPLLTPVEVLKLTPAPSFIQYQ